MVNLAQENLRRLMSQAGLSIDALAERAGLDPRTIRGILDGSKRPHFRTLHQLAAGLSVSADELFLDPSQLLYRHLDRQTNPAVAELVDAEPELFADWTEADFDELHSRFAVGGALSREGALAAVAEMNRNRAAHDQLALLLETSQAELIRGILAVMYDQAVGAVGREEWERGRWGEWETVRLPSEHEQQRRQNMEN